MDNREKMEKVCILGAGSFATAMAYAVAAGGVRVSMWCRDPEQARTMRETSRNPKFLRDVTLPEGVSFTADMAECLRFSRHAILAVPAQAVREVLTRAVASGGESSSYLNLAKGIEVETGFLIHQIAAEVAPGACYGALSGPCHAEELSKGLPTAVVVASSCEDEACLWQRTVGSPRFRVYTSDDVVGVETGGAVKNVIAIAAGICRVMRLGDNALAALATRGLAEIMRLGARLGANPITLAGLAGIGDLMVTCYSLHSRNLRMGIALGEGKTLDEAAREIGQVVEGVFTTRALVKNARSLGVEIPIAQAVDTVLAGHASCEEVLETLLMRAPKPEGV